MSELRELPAGWRWANFGSVVQVASNLVDPQKYLDLPHIAPNHIESNTGVLLPYTTVAEDGVISAKHLFYPGQILYSKIRPYLAKSVLVNFSGLCSADMYPLETSLNPSYLFHWILAPEFTHYASQVQGRTVLPKINRGQLEQLPVPVAPIAEQARIVAVIEEQLPRLDAGVAALGRVRENLGRMRAAILQAAVTGQLVRQFDEDVDSILNLISTERRATWQAATDKPYMEPAKPAAFPLCIPKHWRIASLEAITDPIRVICYGILMPKEHVTDGVPYVRVKDMNDWTINVAGLNRTSHEIAAKYARASLRDGDLLLAIRGSYGRVAIIPPELNGGNITQDSARIAAHPAIDRRYLLYYLGGSVANHYYARVARGVAVKGVNIGDLRSMPVPIPPREEQEAIADEVERQFTFLNNAESTAQMQLRHAQSLRSSILAAAFSGKLVAHDPTDESASDFLARIAEERTSSNGQDLSFAGSPKSSKKRSAHE
jgi:type I restriction enzyme, S subunit